MVNRGEVPKATECTVVSSVSRKSASSIGESYKTIFARMEQVKAGASADANGDPLNNVEKSLSSLGIKLRDATDSFRPLGEVINEIAGRWNTFNDIQKSEIATTIAGVRQRENLLILFENFSSVMRAQGLEANSSGLAMQRYGIYMESIEAKANKLQTAWENLWQHSINSDSIKMFYDLGTAAVDAIDKMGGLPTVIYAVATALAVLNSVQIGSFFTSSWGNISKTFVTSLTSMTAALKIINLNLGAASGLAKIPALFRGIGAGFGAIIGPAGAVILAVVAVIAAINKYNQVVIKPQNEALAASKNAWKNAFNVIKVDGGDATKVLGVYKSMLEGVNEAHKKGGILAAIFADKQKFIKIGLQETLIALQETAKTADEYNKTMEEAIKLAGYKFDADGRMYKESHGQNGVVKNYADELGNVNVLEGQYIQKKDDELRVVERAKQGTIDALNVIAKQEDAYVSLLNILKSVQDQTEGIYDITEKSFTGKMNFDDVTKFIESYQDQISALRVEDGQVKLNTDQLRDYAIEKANTTLKSMESSRQLAVEKAAREDEALSIKQEALEEKRRLVDKDAGFQQIIEGINRQIADIEKLRKSNSDAAKENIAGLDKQIELAKNYAEQTERAIPLSADFVDNLENMMNITGDKMGGMGSGFDKYGLQLTNISEQYQKGEITAKEYFAAINEEVKGMDLKSVFGENQDAAQTFFTGMVTNATQSLEQITSLFNNGQISATEFEDSLIELSDVFLNIGNMAQNFADTLGMTAEQSAGITSALGGISSGVAELSNRKETDIAITQMMAAVTQQNLQAGSEEYATYADNVANAMVSAGMSYTDLNGKVYTTHDEIVGYLQSGTSNFMTFSGRMASTMGKTIEGVVHNIGALLQRMGEAIKGFKGVISITPSLKGMINYDAILGGQKGNWFQVPALELNVSGAQVGQAISDAGASLQNFKADLDEGVYQVPAGAINQVSSAMGDASKAGDRLSNSMKDIGKSASGAADKVKEQQKSLKTLLDMVIAMIKQEKEAEKEALKEQLDGYKKIIDKRKEILDLSSKEQDYLDEANQKQKNLSALQNEVLQLQLDDSEESKAKRLKLQEEIATQSSEIQKDQRHHDVDEQKQALDNEYDTFKEDIDKRIKTIDDYLKQSGQIAQDAMALIDAKSSELYDRLMNYNMKYGDGLKSTVVNAWEEAYKVLDQFKNALGGIDFASAYSQVQSLVEGAANAANGIANAVGAARAAAAEMNNIQSSIPDEDPNSEMAQQERNYNIDLNRNGKIGRHNGIESGFVGGLKSNEEFDKLLKGELVVNEPQMDRFTDKILPSMLNQAQISGSKTGMNIEKMFEIIVQGNLTNDVLPKLEDVMNKAFEKFNNANFMRGNIRSATSFSQ